MTTKTRFALTVALIPAITALCVSPAFAASRAKKPAVCKTYTELKGDGAEGTPAKNSWASRTL